MKKLEHLVLAIGRFHGVMDPSSEAYKLANPLLLRSFALPGKHLINEAGIRIFDSLLNGLKAAMFDIELKASGKSRANAGPDSTLEHFLKCYGINSSAGCDHIVTFLRRALADETISRHTLMVYFADKEE